MQKKKIQKSHIKILADDYDCILIVEQNIFIHVSIINLLEDERTVVNALLDAANYNNYLPLNIDENKTCYNSFSSIKVDLSIFFSNSLIISSIFKNILKNLFF